MMFQRTHLRLLSHLMTLLFVTGALASCAIVQPKPPEKRPAETPSAEIKERQEEDGLLQAYRDFARASLYERDGEYDNAAQYLSRAIDHDPDSVYLAVRMAGLLKALKRYPEALQYAQRGVALDPGSVEGRVVLADLQVLLKNDEAALEAYREALAIDPQQKRVRLILATLYIQKKDYEGAKGELTLLIEKDPDLVIAYYYMGRINLELRNFGEAEKFYQEALQRNEAMEPALFDLGTLYQMRKEYAKATGVYRQLLGFYPNNAVVRERLIHIHYGLGQEQEAEREMAEFKKQSKPGDPGRQALGLIYLRHGKLEESISELDLIVTAWPDDDKSRYYLATAHEEKGNHGQALEHFAKIRRGSEYYTNARIHIAYIYESQEKYEEAVEVLEKAVESEKDKSALYLMLSSVYESKKEYGRALEVLDRALVLDEKNEELLFRKGVVFDKKGDKATCLEQMEKVVALNPGHADALNYIGYTYAEQGIRLDEAMVMIRKALEVKPDSGYIIDSLGWVYFQKGLYDEALKYLEKAASLVPNDPTILEHLGDVYLKKKMAGKSLESYEKALTLNPPDEKRLREKIEGVKKLLQ